MDNELVKLKNNNKKKIVFLVLTIIMCVGVSLAAIYFIYVFKDTRENELETGLVSIEYTEGSQNVTLTDTLPVIDEIGLTNTPYEFTVTNTSAVPINIRFQLIPDDSNTLPVGAVKYALYIDSELVQKDNLSNFEDNTLYLLENLAVNQPINAKLIFWIDYYYDVPGQTFSAEIKVTGESFDIIAE